MSIERCGAGGPSAAWKPALACGAAAAALLLVGSAGCGRELPPSASLSGAVTLDGKPVDSGLLMFHRLDKPGSSPVGAEVHGGGFSAPIVPLGKYRVVLQPEPDTAAMASSGDLIEAIRHAPAAKPAKRPPEAAVEVVASSRGLDIHLAAPGAGP